MPNCKDGTGAPIDCTLNFTIDSTISGPIYVYYQLDNFYQNHRRYVKSRSFNQLKGTYLQVADISSDCDPIKTNADLAPVIKAYDGVSFLDPAGPATPCGLVAKSFFQDTYVMTGPNQNIPANRIPIAEDNIAWESDKQYKFHNIPDFTNATGTYNWTQIQWTDMSNEHFIVWMRTAGLPNFRKLWGRIT